jgi:glycosyltransferase involved in cell wall biosynthesis
MHIGTSKTRLLIFIVAYNAENFIEQVLRRIPPDLRDQYEVEILVIDDASSDATFERVLRVKSVEELPFKLRVLTNPVNQGYGGNQKLGYWYAIQYDFDYVALLHGDGQYAPERLPDLLEPLEDGTADAVLGSRMLSAGQALEGGMPLYKYVGNKILTWFQNKTLGMSLSEFHSGYRVYSVDALRAIPFELNTNDFHFDTEIIIQLHFAGFRIAEVPIPTYYGDEICYVDGMKYAKDVFITTLHARVQDFNIYYDRKFDCKRYEGPVGHYRPKLGYRSPHSLAMDTIEAGSRVLDLGCAGGYLAQALRVQRECEVTGVDLYPLASGNDLHRFIVHDLDSGLPSIDISQYDYILLLDVIEHLKSPEDLVSELRQAAHPSTKIIVSTANIGFLLTRLSLLLGNFNYGRRGILDLTHKRLFTFASIENLFEQSNYEILRVVGVPIPFPLIFGKGFFARILLLINRFLIWLRKSLFAFQSYLVVQPRPTLSYLLEDAFEESKSRSQAYRERRVPSSASEGYSS